jgi:curved DNA-binding protein CbpA
MEDLYALLGIEPTASAEEIRVAYRKHVIAVHRAGVLAIVDRMKKVRATAERLRDPERRREYDAERERWEKALEWWNAQAAPPSPRDGERRLLMAASEQVKRDAQRLGQRALAENRSAVDRIARDYDEDEEAERKR